MRWRHPRYEDERVIKRFALFPKRCNLTNNVYWLERVFLYQTWRERWRTQRVSPVKP